MRSISVDPPAPARQRILQALIATAASKGYGRLSVSAVIETAGAARSTFYQHFSDINACFQAALTEIADQVEESVVARSDEPSAMAIIGPLLDFVAADEMAARCLFIESLAAGPLARDRRDELCGALARRVAAGWSRRNGAQPNAERTALILMSGVFRLLAMRLRHGASGLDTELAEGLRSWVRSYAEGDGEPWPAFQRDWRRGRRQHPLPAMPRPPVLQSGRHHLPRRDVERNQRERLLVAVAQLSYEEGYSSLSVTKIAAAARVARNVFYQQFRDREELAAAANESFFQHAMAAAAGAFFAQVNWPERVWAAGSALLDFIAAHPANAYMGFVETHAIGPSAVQIAYERLGAFTLFLEEGYARLPEDSEVGRVTSEALAAVMFEVVYRELRVRRNVMGLPAKLPGLAYATLAPFLGPDEARRFIEGKTERSQVP
ncbi:MAG: TetR/AcrR family transcriptional regulator [Solirubrobacterales bacterium]